MKWWVLIPTGFGLWWLSSGFLALFQRPIEIMIGLCAAAAIVALIGLRFGRVKSSTFAHKFFRRALIGEGVGIGLIVVLGSVLNQPSFIKPLVGAVIGIHFLPLAKVFGDRAFFGAGILMTAVSLSALLWPSPMREAVAGIGGGAILWLLTLGVGLMGARKRRLVVEP